MELSAFCLLSVASNALSMDAYGYAFGGRIPYRASRSIHLSIARHIECNKVRSKVDAKINQLNVYILENVATANALQLEAAAARRHARQSFCSLFTTPCQVWSRWTYPICHIAFLLLIQYAVILTFDLEHLQCVACDVMKLCTKFERNRALRGGDFNIWPNDLEHVTCGARLWDNFHQVLPSTIYPCLNYSVFYADTLYHTVTLTFDP